jgi:probable rRNA maturation factor
MEINFCKHIEIWNNQDIVEIKEERVRYIVEKILKYEHVKVDEISIVFCDDKFIQKLNKEYRNVDTPTDVLAFHTGNIHDFPITSLGDVVISVETAIRQAEEYNHDVNNEIELLLIHGILHLLGYDHSSEDLDKEEMYKKQMKLFNIICD